MKIVVLPYIFSLGVRYRVRCDTYRIDFLVFLCYTLQSVFYSAIESIGIHAQDTGYSDRTLPRSDKTEISEALADAVSHIASVDENFAPQIAEALRYFVQLIFHRRSLEERDALVDIIKQHIQDHKEQFLNSYFPMFFVILLCFSPTVKSGKSDIRDEP